MAIKKRGHTSYRHIFLGQVSRYKISRKMYQVYHSKKSGLKRSTNRLLTPLPPKKIWRQENFRDKMQVPLIWLEPCILIVNSTSLGPGVLSLSSPSAPFIRQVLMLSAREEWATQQYLSFIFFLPFWNMPGIALQMAWEWVKRPPREPAFSLRYWPGKTWSTHLILGLSEPIEPWLLLKVVSKDGSSVRTWLFYSLGTWSLK